MKIINLKLLDMNLDIIRYIGLNISDFIDLINFLSSSRLLWSYFDNYFFIAYSYKLYSEDFWEKALLRPIIKSRPLNTMYEELLRIEKFQNALVRNNYSRFTVDQFYNYWKKYDYFIENI